MNTTGFNTSTLGYKLLSGKLKKHSEQLNKFLAGLFDADGCVMLNFDSRGYINLQWKLAQSNVTDTDFEMLRGLQKHYGKGNLYYYTPTDERKSPVCEWRAFGMDAIYMSSHLKKHSRIKAQHIDNLEYVYLELRGFKYTDTQAQEIKDYSECSRKHSKWLKHPKHPSWAWMAGIMAGDGHFRFRQKLREFRNGEYMSNDLLIKLTGHEDDRDTFEFIKKAFKGRIVDYKEGKGIYWIRSMGKNSESFALPFLKNIRKYMCLKKKYETINKMIDFHETNRQQRLK